MKKITILSLLITLALCSCSNSGTKDADSPSSAETTSNVLTENSEADISDGDKADIDKIVCREEYHSKDGNAESWVINDKEFADKFRKWADTVPNNYTEEENPKENKDDILKIGSKVTSARYYSEDGTEHTIETTDYTIANIKYDGVYYNVSTSDCGLIHELSDYK